MKKFIEYCNDVSLPDFPVRKTPYYKICYYQEGKCVAEVEETNETSRERCELNSKYKCNERVKIDDPEFEAAVAHYSEVFESAVELWYMDLQNDYAYLVNPNIFKICYDEAYDRGHSGGYDEVANYMIGIVQFAQKIMNECNN